MKLCNEKIKEIQGVLLDMLKFFKCFCEENNLTFYLAYGSCLGAIREHGFIPWDDDVDIVMPPDDYKRLTLLWPAQTTKEHYTLCDTTREYCDHHMALTIRDDNTTYITDGDTDSDTHHGIMIEIGPFSPCPKSVLKKMMQTVNGCIYAIFRTQRKPNSGGNLQKNAVACLLGLFYSENVRYKLWKHAEQKYILWDGENNGYSRNFGQMHTLKRFFPNHVISGVKWVPFEDTTMPVVGGYKDYLTLLYGDYMTPPPADKQQPPHEVVFVDCTKSYKEYRGHYYLKNGK